MISFIKMDAFEPLLSQINCINGISFFVVQGPFRNTPPQFLIAKSCLEA